MIFGYVVALQVLFLNNQMDTISLFLHRDMIFCREDAQSWCIQFIRILSGFQKIT